MAVGPWLQVCDFGVIGRSIHNYSGMTFVSWDYYMAGYGKVLLQSSLRTLDSADLPLLRIPTTWVWALSMISCGAPALLRAVSVQVTISAMGICLSGRAKLRPLARTDV